MLCTTVRQILDGTEKKYGPEDAIRYKVGKKFFYSAALDKDEMASESIKEVAEQFFNSDYADLIRFVENKFDLIK